MDPQQFDALTRRLAGSLSRRALLPGIGAFLIARGDASTRKKKNKKTTFCLNGQTINAKKKKKKKLLKQGATKGACAVSPPPPVCTPICSGTTCGGDDGCGGICGCPAGTICHNGLCKPCDIACPAGRANCNVELQNLLNSGGIVLACPGRYVGTYSLPVNVTLIGAGQGDDPATSTILDGNGAGSVFSVPPGVTATLQQLRITGGNANEGAGIKNSGSLTVSDCTLTGNRAVGGFGSGGGISSNAPVTLVRCTVSGNTAAGSGGGIENFSSMTIDACIISGNQAGNGGGFIGHAASSTNIVNGSRVTGNNAGNKGGGIASNERITFDRTCSVTENEAADGGGIYRYANVISLNGATVANNKPNNCASLSGPPDC